jgi:hypothetical protein
VETESARPGILSIAPVKDLGDSWQATWRTSWIW